jgi:hypothetical protein
MTSSRIAQLAHITDLLLKEYNPCHLLIVIDSLELLPAREDMRGNIVFEFLNHG